MWNFSIDSFPWWNIIQNYVKMWGIKWSETEWHGNNKKCNILFSWIFWIKMTILFSTKTLSYYKTSFKFKFSLVLWPNVTNKIEKAVWLNVKSEKHLHSKHFLRGWDKKCDFFWRDLVSPIPLSNMHWEEKKSVCLHEKGRISYFPSILRQC